MVAVMTDRMRMGLALGGLTGLAAVAGAMWWQAGAPWGDARL
ncbi:MAG: hypothetical protein JWP20_52, partial [Roseomonas sp.]|nr:hypothetical protein [Roseomonas sp.]